MKEMFLLKMKTTGGNCLGSNYLEGNCPWVIIRGPIIQAPIVRGLFSWGPLSGGMRGQLSWGTFVWGAVVRGAIVLEPAIDDGKHNKEILDDKNV